MGLLEEQAAILSFLSLFPSNNCSVLLGAKEHLDIGNWLATRRPSSDMTLYLQCI